MTGKRGAYGIFPAINRILHFLRIFAQESAYVTLEKLPVIGRVAQAKKELRLESTHGVRAAKQVALKLLLRNDCSVSVR